MSLTTTSIPDELIPVFLSDERITASISVVGWTILLYDSFATFTEEVEFIWKTPWSLMNMVYLTLRYLTLVFLGVDVFVMLTPQSSDTLYDFCDFLRVLTINLSCHKMIWLELVTGTVLFSIADLVFVARLWILYARSRVVLVGGLFLATCEIIIMFTLGALTAAPMSRFVYIPGLSTGCFPLTIRREIRFYPLPMIFMSTLMFGMTLHKCRQNYGALRYWRQMPLMALFFRDGIVWFFCLFVGSMGELFVWNYVRDSLAELPIIFTLAIMCVISTRVLVNIKQALHGTGFGYPTQRPDDDTTELSTFGPWRVPDHGQATTAFSERRDAGQHTDTAP